MTPPLNSDLGKEFVTMMHTITSQQNTQLGLTPTTEVHVEGCPVTAVLDTWSPATIISLDFLLQTLAKQKKPGETPQAWRERIEKQLEPPSILLLRSTTEHRGAGEYLSR
jgi:hypothetical protein